MAAKTSPRPLILISGPLNTGDFEAARAASLWRALCQCAETWHIEVGENGKSRSSRHRMCRGSDVPQILNAVLADSGAADVIVTTGAGLSAEALPEGLRLIGVADADGNVPPAATEVWMRTKAEKDRRGKDMAEPRVVADSFFPGPPAPVPHDSRVAVIGVPGRALLQADIAAALEGASEVLVSPENHQLLSELLDRPLTLAPTRAAAAEAAGSLVICGTWDFAQSMHSWAVLSGRKILWTELDAEAQTGGLDPLETLRDVAAALGIARPDSPAEVGALIARNLGLELSPVSATFNKWVRLYHAIYDARGNIPSGCLGGRIRLRSGEEGLVNAWITDMTPPPEIPARLRATTALETGVTANQVVIEIEAWGWPVASFEKPETMQQETGGLIGLALTEGRRNATVRYWSQKTGTPIQLGRKPLSPEPTMARKGRPVTYEASGEYPFNRDTLTVLPPEGVGQKFTNFARLNHAKMPSSMRLQQMKNSLAGQTAWLIGNGPSVQLEDLDRLAETGAISFGFNRFHLAHETTQLRPTFTVTGDLQMIEDFGQQIVDESGGTVFVANDDPPNLIGDYIWIRQVGVFPSLFSSDAALGVTPGGSSVYVAMQIGYYLGIRRWYLYGADFSFKFSPPKRGSSAFRSAEGEGNHFISNYRSGRPWCPPAIENILPSFYAARLMMEMDGGFIRNATRGGHLNVFERINFERALADTAKADSRT